LLDLATRLAREAGSLLVQMRRGHVATRGKSSVSDLVTEADVAAQELVVTGILGARPYDGVLAEEGAGRPAETGLTWVVDPLDGTTNYVRGYPGWAVSICVRRDAQAVVAAVYDPMRDVLYTAISGEGAWRNEQRITVSATDQLSRSLVATGFSYDAGRRGEQGEALARLLPLVADVRRGGAASLELCHVAEGALDAFAESDLGEWDWAAGALIVAEAGGVVSRWNPHEGADGVVAGASAVFAQLWELLGPPRG
jgi:myo-inositol-1(or 4)-monophosphatase